MALRWRVLGCAFCVFAFGALTGAMLVRSDVAAVVPALLAGGVSGWLADWVTSWR